MSREKPSASEQYIIDHFGREDDYLVRVRQALNEDGKLGINVSAVEGKFLQFLVGATQAKTIVEVGVLYGYSTLWMAKALPPEGKLFAIERDERNYVRAKELIAACPYGERVELICGDAREILATLTVAPDLVFIDADKVNYRHYLDWAMKAVKVGGVIVGDNTFLFGHLIGEDRGEKTSPTAIESMRYFNEALAKAPNFRATMIPTYEGLTLAHRLS